MSDVSGPYVTIASSSEGVVASWSSSDTEVTTVGLDGSGRARGGGRVLASDARWLLPALWELGDGVFVLAFSLKMPPLPSAHAPRQALQRVDASGALVGSPVPLALDSIRAVVPFRNELLFLTSHASKRELLRVTAREGGLEVKQVALPDSPADTPLRQSVLATSSGGVWVVADHLNGGRTIDREEGASVKVTLPSDFQHSRAVLSEDDEPLWLACRGTPTVKGQKLHAGQLVEVELPRRVCDGPLAWSVTPDTSMYDNKNRGLVFKPRPLDPGISLTKEAREYWGVQAAWTGTQVIAIYATGKRGDWTVVAHPITCEPSAPPPAASAPASPAGATRECRNNERLDSGCVCQKGKACFDICCAPGSGCAHPLHPGGPSACLLLPRGSP